jgi:hypothetical protein
VCLIEARQTLARARITSGGVFGSVDSPDCVDRAADGAAESAGQGEERRGKEDEAIELGTNVEVNVHID